MKVAVIGVHGYLGKHLAHFLLQKGWEVEGYGRRNEPPFELSRYTQLDITKKEQFMFFNPDINFVFYCAGITGTTKAYEEYGHYLDVNEKGLLHLLDTLRVNASKARVVFPSTRLVYKGDRDKPLPEEAAKEFKTIYALNKWFGEQILEQYNRYFNLDYTIFRICVPYGNFFGEDYSYGTIGFFLKKALAGNDIILFGDGNQKRTFIHIGDICEQIFGTIQLNAAANNVLNLGGETFSLKEIAEKISAQFGTRVICSEWPDLEYKLESGDTIFDATKILSLSRIPLRYSFSPWLTTMK